jgi:hypothetical protein
MEGLNKKQDKLRLTNEKVYETLYKHSRKLKDRIFIAVN